MTKQEFLERVVWASRVMPHLPVTTALLEALAAELKAGDPPWWKKTMKAWEGRRFVSWTDSWGLFLSAVHFEVLSHADNPLNAFFPSCGGTPEADCRLALRDFLEAAPETFYENLSHGERRPFAEYRAMQWMTPAVLCFHARRMPYYLVEINAGGGLNLAADLIHKLPRFDRDLIAARIGLDSKPLLLEDIAQRRWLTAALMPDQLPWLETLDRFADRLLQEKRSDPNFIQLVECRAELAPKFIAKNIPAGDPEVGLLVFNTATTSRMTDAEYEDFRQAMADTLRPWGDRAVWVEVEPVRGEKFSVTLQVRAHRCKDGLLKPVDLGRMNSYQGKAQFDLKAGADFLFVAPTSYP